MSRITVHELAIKKVMTRRPEKLMTTGVNAFLKKLDDELGIGLEENDRFISRPDAWSYVPFANAHLPGKEHIPGALNIFEIEDTHMLSTEKLREYSELWFNFDDLDLELNLFVYDRYGEQEKQLCLCEYWLMYLHHDVEMAKKAG